MFQLTNLRARKVSIHNPPHQTGLHSELQNGPFWLKLWRRAYRGPIKYSGGVLTVNGSRLRTMQHRSSAMLLWRGGRSKTSSLGESGQQMASLAQNACPLESSPDTSALAPLYCLGLGAWGLQRQEVCSFLYETAFALALAPESHPVS